MKFPFSLSISLAAVAVFVSGVSSLMAEPSPIHVLFLGHESPHHNSNVYYPIIRDALAPESIEIDYVTKVDALTADNLQKYDAVLLYANHGKITPEQFDALRGFVESGHGFVPVHCASACFGQNADFVKLVGARFKSHKSGVFSPAIVNPEHPVMAGLSAYETWDETYVHANHNEEGRTVLMERVEGEVREPWTWVREQGKGRVFYTASGHDERTWKDTGFQKLLRNGVVWAVGESRRTEWEQYRKSLKKPE
ncbi:MAG: ThuA domain-containing protein [Verrucomicrobiota bacterium]